LGFGITAAVIAELTFGKTWTLWNLMALGLTAAEIVSAMSMQNQVDPLAPIATSIEAGKLLNLLTHTIRDMIHSKELPPANWDAIGASRRAH